jgi:hypothetical protein
MDLKHDNGRLKLERAALLPKPLPKVFPPSRRSRSQVATLDRLGVESFVPSEGCWYIALGAA